MARLSAVPLQQEQAGRMWAGVSQARVGEVRGEKQEGVGVWGTVPSVGNVAQPPLRKASRERGWRAGPTSMDKFSSGKSGLHCT